VFQTEHIGPRCRAYSTGNVGVVQPLHDDHDRRALVVEAVRHRFADEPNCLLALQVALGLDHIVGIVEEDAVAADRLSTAESVELPMSRQDIADYLGLTIETVSRTLTHLEAKAVIALPTSRRIVLRNRKALIRLDA
jgi:CRP-like cAMP-binding protein